MTGSRPTALVTLETDRLRVQVQRALEAALISGELVPGEVYSAPSLALAFGVSATPVREAMLALVRKGYVETVPNKGFRITKVSEADLDNIARIRQLVEVPIMADIAKSLPRLDKEGLESTADLIEAAAKAGDLIAYVGHDESFHLSLVRSLENPQLMEIISDLRAHTRLFGLEHLADQGELVSSAREHRELLELLFAGRVDEAIDLMRVHISHTRGKWAGPVDGLARGQRAGTPRGPGTRAGGIAKSTSHRPVDKSST